jgi:hypothetical protein
MDINHLTIEELKIVKDAIIQRISKLSPNEGETHKFVVDDVEIHLNDKQAAHLLNQLHDFVYKQNGDSKFE